MDWESFIKKYIWDDDKTPYFVSVHALTKYQASHELFAYTLFIGVIFSMIAIFSLTENAPHGVSRIMALYAFTVASSAVVFGVTKHVLAACYFALAPLATLGYFLFWGFPPNLATIDKAFLVAITLGLQVYSLRVVAIAKAYPTMPEKAKDQ
jgi:hypothetical protein